VNTTLPAFRPPTAGEKIFNSIFGFLIGLGMGPAYVYLLEVRGRKSGKLYSTPVSLMERNGKKYLVAPRGQTQWVRNAEAANEITLKKGSKRSVFHLRALAGGEKLEVLKAYLDAYKRDVQRFFTIPAGSPVEAFAPVAESYPAYELLA